MDSFHATGGAPKSPTVRSAVSKTRRAKEVPMMKKMPHILANLSVRRVQALAASATLSFLFAAPVRAEQPAPQIDEDGQDIVVTAQRLEGSVVSPVAADVVLDGAAVQSYGASNVADLLSALSAQTRTARGRGDGRPVILLNGKRISGFSEIRDLPTEAIMRVEILPEDVALRFGYTADQRVVNFILRPGFKAVTGEAEIGAPTAGGRTEFEGEAGLVRISKNGRLNIDTEYSRYDAILEKERAIVPQGSDQTAFRTLAPSNDSFKLNTVLNRALAPHLGVTVNVQYNRADNSSLLGLATGMQNTALTRDARTRSLSGGLTLDGRVSRFNWTATASGERTSLETLTDQDVAAPAARDRTRSRLTVGMGAVSITGPAVELPAGPVTVNLTLGGEVRDVQSETLRAGSAGMADLARQQADGRANIDIPLTSRRRAILPELGDFSLNLNGGYAHLSDFKAVTAYGYGLTWSPLKGATLLASYAVAEAAPTASQIGDARLVTPNALVYDYARGETALVTLTTGGNPLLRSERRRDIKLGATYSPSWVDGLTLTATYFRNRSTDPVANFPALTDIVAMAFPERLARNSAGVLTSVDQRAINFLGARSEQLRWGLNYQKQFGQAGPGGRRGMPSMGGFGGQGGRWSVALYHTVKFVDKVDLAANVPTLNLLDGDATGQSGGSPRHGAELEGGWFNKGVGFRVNGSYQSATSVRGGGAASDLNFSDLALLNVRAFISFDQKRQMIDAMPWLKGVRVVLRVDNLLNDIQDVRDQNAAVPLRYQPGYLDPVGRRVQLNIRKIF